MSISSSGSSFAPAPRRSLAPAVERMQRTQRSRATAAPVNHNARNSVVIGLLAAVLVGWYLWVHRAPPQLGNDPLVVRTVDALFTALTSRNAARLDHCESRLAEFRKQGTLTSSADERLTAVIKQARTGEWLPAAQELAVFIQGQTGDQLPGEIPAKK